MLKDYITFLVYEAVQFKCDFRDMFMWMNEIHVSLYYLSYLQFCCIVEEVRYTVCMRTGLGPGGDNTLAGC